MSEANPRKRLAVDTVLLDSMMMEYMTSEELVDSSASNSTPQVADTLKSYRYVEACILCFSVRLWSRDLFHHRARYILVGTETPACSQERSKAQEKGCRTV